MQHAAEAGSTHRWRGRRSIAALFVCACAMAYAAMATQHGRPAVPEACQPVRPHDTKAHDAFSALREHAIMGDSDASAALVRALLDAYEARANASALVDALQWLQRDLYTPQMLASGQIARVIQGACRDTLLSEQWLCHQGE